MQNYSRFSPRFLAAPLLALLLAALGQPAVAEEAPAAPRELVRKALRQRLDGLKTAKWKHDIWATNGEDEQHTIGEAYWRDDGRIRIDIVGGDNKGGTAILVGDKVVGWKRGMLSFAKLSFEYTNKRVLSVRGQTMKMSGFLDDFRAILEQDDAVVTAASKDEFVVDYRGDQGFPTRMWLRLSELYPYRIEVREGDKVVEKHVYSDVEYNPSLDADLFEP